MSSSTDLCNKTLMLRLAGLLQQHLFHYTHWCCAKGMSTAEESFARRVQFCTSCQAADAAPVSTNTDCLFVRKKKYNF
jgi:hypothetical protein